MNTNEDFKAFYEKYLRFSIGIAEKIVKDRALAEDISQDVFYHLYRIVETIDLTDDRKLHALVTISTVNKAKDYLKKKHVKVELFHIDDQNIEVMDPGGNPEDFAVKKEEADYKKLVLQKLKEKNPMNYDILMKVKCLDMSPDAVADEYGLTRNDVNNRILRTKKWLNKELRKIRKD